MARKRKLKNVSLAQPQKEVPLDLRPNTILNPGQRVIGIEVDNPNKPDEKVIVWRSTRDWLFMDYAAGNIDEAQRLAGEHWRECYRLTEIGGVRGQDLTREYVDTSSHIQFEPIGDKQIRAAKDMKKASKALGLLEGWVVRRILGDGLCPSRLAELFGGKTQQATAEIAQTFRGALQKLALAFTYCS